MCVEADFESKNRSTVTVLVSIGTFKGGPTGVPALLKVTITDVSGISRPVRHLGDLPMELHRPAPRLPRDLPVPVGALVVGPQSREYRPSDLLHTCLDSQLVDVAGQLDGIFVDAIGSGLDQFI